MGTDHLRFAFVGDVCLAYLKRTPAQLPRFTDWPAIQREIGEHDFLVGNLECCLVDDSCSDKARRQPMATPASVGAFLRDTGFSDLCVANNHSMDCGAESLAVTRKHLSSLGIRSFGAGSDLREAESPVFVERDGRRVAFLGACDRGEDYASTHRAGTAPLEKSRLGERVRTAVAQADVVIVTLHADLEFCDVPGRWRQRLSRWLIDQGAHLVIQHHPHVLQGIETYKHGVIAYSLGNFIFQLHRNRYQQDQPGVFDSMVLIIDADLRGRSPRFTHRVVPLSIGNDHLPHQLTGSAREQALHRVQALSSQVCDTSTHRNTWFRRCRIEARKRFWHVYYTSRRHGMTRGMRELGQMLACREDHRWMLGLMSLGFL